MQASHRTVASTRPESKETVMDPTHHLRRLTTALGRGSLRRAARTIALSAVAVVALGALAAAPAVASTAPSMITTGNDTEIAVQGPNHSLHLYWATNGVAGWNPEKVAGAGTTFSAPAMTNNG